MEWSAAAWIVIMGGPIVLAWLIFHPQRGVQGGMATMAAQAQSGV